MRMCAYITRKFLNRSASLTFLSGWGKCKYAHTSTCQYYTYTSIHRKKNFTPTVFKTGNCLTGLKESNLASYVLVSHLSICNVDNSELGHRTPSYWLTYSTVQSPSWAANWFAASQKILRISRNPKVHYRTYKRPPSVSILGQPNPVHIPTSHLLEIHPNIIHPSMPRAPQSFLSLRLLEQLTGLQLVKKFPAFHGTRRFSTALTSHLSLSWASPIQSIYPHPTSFRSVLI
jgi:hypothetical protein